MIQDHLEGLITLLLPPLQAFKFKLWFEQETLVMYHWGDTGCLTAAAVGSGKTASDSGAEKV